MKKLILALIILSSICLFSADKIAVLPFNNADGLLKMEIWSYDIQDSIYKSLLSEDPNGQVYELVSPDEIEDVLAELNLDPSNPQYKSDMWKAVKMLGANKVITGRFNFEAGNIIINAYIYHTKFKMADPNYKAKNIFRAEDKILSAIPEIVENLLPGLKN